MGDARPAIPLSQTVDWFRRHGLGRADALDAAHDVFWRTARGGTAPSSAYWNASCCGILGDFRERRRRDLGRRARDEDALDGVAAHDDVERAVVGIEQKRLLERALGTVPQRQARVFAHSGHREHPDRRIVNTVGAKRRSLGSRLSFVLLVRSSASSVRDAGGGLNAELPPSPLSGGTDRRARSCGRREGRDRRWHRRRWDRRDSRASDRVGADW